MECGLVRERGIVAEKIGAPKFKINNLRLLRSLLD